MREAGCQCQFPPVQLAVAGQKEISHQSLTAWLLHPGWQAASCTPTVCNVLIVKSRLYVWRMQDNDSGDAMSGVLLWLLILALPVTGLASGRY